MPHKKLSDALPNSSANQDPTPWMKPVPAADYLGVSLKTLRNWTSARYVPFAKRGRVVRYHRAQLDAWLSRGACPGRATLANAPRT